MAKTVMTDAAKALEKKSEYSEDIVCVDTGGPHASGQVRTYGVEEDCWNGTPFQNAGFRLLDLASWLYSEGGCCSYLASVSDDGSAAVHEVAFDDDGRPEDVDRVEELGPLFWLDQAMVAAIKVGGDRAHGGDVAAAVEAWLEVGFDAGEAGEWLEAGVFNADAARALYDADIAPARVAGPCGVDGGGYTLGYRYANRDVTLDDVKRAIEDD